MRPGRHVIQITFESRELEEPALSFRPRSLRDARLFRASVGWCVVVGRSVHRAAIRDALVEKISFRLRGAFRASSGRISRLSQRKRLGDQSITFFCDFRGDRRCAGRRQSGCGKQQDDSDSGLRFQIAHGGPRNSLRSSFTIAQQGLPQRGCPGAEPERVSM